MTRETKIGLVVAASFLCLVGIVVASKWNRGEGTEEEQTVVPGAVLTSNAKDSKDAKSEAKKEAKPQSSQVAAAQKKNPMGERKDGAQSKSSKGTSPPLQIVGGLPLPTPTEEAAIEKERERLRNEELAKRAEEELKKKIADQKPGGLGQVAMADLPKPPGEPGALPLPKPGEPGALPLPKPVEPGALPTVGGLPLPMPPAEPGALPVVGGLPKPPGEPGALPTVGGLPKPPGEPGALPMVGGLPKPPGEPGSLPTVGGLPKPPGEPGALPTVGGLPKPPGEPGALPMVGGLPKPPGEPGALPMVGGLPKPPGEPGALPMVGGLPKPPGEPGALPKDGLKPGVIPPPGGSQDTLKPFNDPMPLPQPKPSPFDPAPKNPSSPSFGPLPEASKGPVATIPPNGNTSLPSLPPIIVGGRPGPVASDSNIDFYEVKQGENTFAVLSTRLYGSDKYADALLKYNREHSALIKNGSVLNINPPPLGAGQQVLKPPVALLERDYGSSIKVAPPQARILDTPQPLNTGPIIAPVSSPPALGAGRVYTVQNAGGESMLDIAERVLGDRTQWHRIWRVNQSYPPQNLIPAGTKLTLPSS